MLEHLIAPHTAAEFFAEFWEQRPLLVHRGNPHYYDDILREQDVERLFADRFAIKPDAIEIFHPDPNAKARRQPGTVEHISNAYKLGCTIRCAGAEQIHAPIRTMCQRLEAEFSAEVRANIYCTPPNAHGLRRHFDCHDTLILQIGGRKHWKVFPPALELPLEYLPALPFETRAQTDERFSALNVEYGKLAAGVTEQQEDYLLERGDFLYVPRGWVHEPSTQHESSTHVTIGLYSLTWRDALAAALNRLADSDVRFRRALPIGFLNERLSDSYQEDARTLLRELADRLDLPAAISELARQFAAIRATPSMNLSTPSAADITCDSIIRRAAEHSFRVIREESRTGLRWGTRTVWAPLPVADAFERLASTSSIRVGDLGCGLSEQAMVTLAKRLVREGAFVLDN